MDEPAALLCSVSSREHELDSMPVDQGGEMEARNHCSNLISGFTLRVCVCVPQKIGALFWRPVSYFTVLDVADVFSFYNLTKVLLTT